MIDWRDVRIRRQELGLPLHALAAFADVNTCSLSEFERGSIVLSADKILRIVSALKAARRITAESPVPVDWRRVGRLRTLVRQMQAAAESGELTAIVG